MAHLHAQMSSEYLAFDKFKNNDERFRNTMEDIFQKYSSLDDPGPDVCFRTMTFRTGKGAVPIESVAAKQEMHRLRSHIIAQQSLQNTSVGLHTAKVEHDFSEQEMDVTQITENETGRSSQMENSLCDHTKTSQLSVSETHGYTWVDASQPEEDDQDLERTLSSHGSTLLDVYPSMLDQIGKACRWQRVTDAASTVLRRYRRQRWQPPRLCGRRTQSDGRSIASVQPLRDDAGLQLGRTSVQAGSVGRSKLELSPCRSMRNLPSVSSICFYSPRRENLEASVAVETGSRHRPVHVLDLISLSSSSSCSPASDLNQTFDVERVSVPSLQGFPTVCSPSRPKCNSPLKAVKSPLIVGRGGRPEISSPSYNSCSGLEQECTNGFLAQVRFRNGCCSSAPSVQRALTGSPLLGGRSPLRPRVLSLEQKRQKSSSMYYPNQTLPVDRGDTSVVYRSPHRSQRVLLASPHYKYRQNLTMAAPHQVSPRPSKRWRSLSGHQTVSSSVSHMSRRHIDAEFRRIYHHFICQGTSSSCFTSSCHLCERRSDDPVQNRPLSSSSSLSALALTPPWSRLKKRRRQPEMEESPRFKRFRESYSPVSWNKRRANAHVSTAMEEPNEDKRTWNRAFLLQCPSPGFLRASESSKKVPGYKLGLPIPQHSPSWRHTSSCMGEVEAKSPMRTWNQSGVSPSPSISRRRLLYGPLQ